LARIVDLDLVAEARALLGVALVVEGALLAEAAEG